MAQLLLQLLELVDDLTLLQRTSLVVLPLREPRLALLLAFFESVSPRSQLAERDRSALVGVHQPAVRSVNAMRFAHQMSALPLVRREHRVGLVALRVELGRQLLGLLEPSLEVLLHDVLNVISAQRWARARSSVAPVETISRAAGVVPTLAARVGIGDALPQDSTALRTAQQPPREVRVLHMPRRTPPVVAQSLLHHGEQLRVDERRHARANPLLFRPPSEERLAPAVVAPIARALRFNATCDSIVRSCSCRPVETRAYILKAFMSLPADTGLAGATEQPLEHERHPLARRPLSHVPALDLPLRPLTSSMSHPQPGARDARPTAT
ncbi:hypothetical protein WMF16_49600 [Sorangium sp. So ce388]